MRGKNILICCLLIFGFVIALPSLAAPLQVTGVKVTKIKSNAATVSWIDQSDVAKYIVKVKTKQTKKLKVTKKSTTNSVIVKPLKKKKYYRVKVRAKDSFGNLGPWSKVKLFRTKSWRYYHNNKYGFNLKFPKSWKGMKAQRETIEGINHFYFNVPTTSHDYNGYASLFAISVYTLEDWQEIENLEYAPIYGTKLDENDDYAFVYSHCQDAPTDILELLQAINDIIDTFVLD